MTTNHWPAGTFMARVGADTATRLLALAPPRRLSADDVLIGQGENREMILLLSPPEAGEPAFAKVTSVLRNGTEVMLGIRVHGDVVGEMGMFRASGASATVMACTPMTVRSYTYKVFRDFLDGHRDAWEAVGAVMGDRLESADRHRAEFVGYEVDARLARVLVDLGGRHGIRSPEGVELGVRLSQTDLGKLIGARTDAVGNAMRRFRDEGLLLTRYRHVVIIDMDRLHAVYEKG
ncbi:Crp/Fnr family transcriptional regulator [Streptomonospora nanhaiensis]|uniref:Crp/Fnr family transcriptional regulator n=1 Tax=Streptomonospora nanhaiensis TaxID=1323731 RepID=A0ABY6YLS7_9ACTN|nr:Crp/Fnr family transcriptional regulator [Streptomonospora nanhaiensis]WAE73319.1 Crp/Fnr family transcriptional regulator [Streptomonospora nanhaiensis]